MATSDPTIGERDDVATAGIQKLRFNPLTARDGRASYFTADDGRAILDLSASATAASLG